MSLSGPNLVLPKLWSKCACVLTTQRTGWVPSSFRSARISSAWRCEERVSQTSSPPVPRTTQTLTSWGWYRRWKTPSATSAQAVIASRLGRGPLAQPVVPRGDAVPGARRDRQHRGAGADLPQVGGAAGEVEVDVGQQVGLADQHEAGAAEHVRVLDRLVGALGDRGEHHAVRLAQVEQGRADQVPHVLDYHHRAVRGVQRGEGLADHRGVEVAPGSGVDLHYLAACRAHPVRVQRGLLVPLDDADDQLAGQVARGALEQRGLARAG